MRGKLLRTFRLGLNKQAPDYKAIDYVAMRDQCAQLAQATVLPELVPRKDLSQKYLSIYSVTFSSQPLESSWSSFCHFLSLS